MTRFKPRTSGVGSDRFTNWATSTALYNFNLYRRHHNKNNFLLNFGAGMEVVNKLVWTYLSGYSKLIWNNHQLG